MIGPTENLLEPLRSVFKINEDEVSRNASEANPASYSCVDRVRVQRQEDHEEARDTEHHREEERDLWKSQE